MNAVSIDEAMPVMLELLNNGNCVSLVVTGNSMYPFLISNRDTVLLKQVDSPLKKGDIVLYKRKDKVILHRISRVDKDGKLEIIGDGQFVADYPVLPENIIARVDSVIRKGKKLYSNNVKWKIFSCPLFIKLSRKTLLKNAMKKGSEKNND